MSEVKFISYDGAWPNLCRGTLEVEVNGKIHVMKGAIQSGGSAGVFADGKSYCRQGKWFWCEYFLEMNPEIQALGEETLNKILELVNKNVQKGCCGGCI